MSSLMYYGATETHGCGGLHGMGVVCPSRGAIFMALFLYDLFWKVRLPSAAEGTPQWIKASK